MGTEWQGSVVQLDIEMLAVRLRYSTAVQYKLYA